jgi:ABC-type nitrate/sulfonate/bicarbonate transport system substrate-binding protein
MAPVQRLKLIFFRAAYNLPVTAGMERGIFAKHGLELDIVYTRGSQMTSAALLGGECDIGALAADDVVYEVEAHGADLFAFLGLHGGILQLVGRPEIRHPRELVGGRLGVDDPASGFALVAHKILATMGLRRSDYQTLAMGGQEFRARALAEGKIDFTLSTPPFSLELVSGGFNLLARAHEYLPRYQASCAVATRRWAAKNGQTIAAYARAYRESLAWTLDAANREPAIDHLVAQFNLKRELAAATYEALVDREDGLFRDAQIDVPGVRTVLGLRVEAGLLPDPPPDPSKYCQPA